MNSRRDAGSKTEAMPNITDTVTTNDDDVKPSYGSWSFASWSTIQDH